MSAGTTRLFDGCADPVNGLLAVPDAGPGHGLTPRFDEAAPLRVA